MADINDSGPAYPPPPRAGSNAIGKFEIGVSPVGDIPAFNWWDTVASQYANAEILTSIIGSFFAAADQTENFDAFYDLIWNVATAQGYGLDVWGRIVGINRILQVPIGVEWFGFGEALPGVLGWDTNARPVLAPYLGWSEALPGPQSFGWGVWGQTYDWIEGGGPQGGGTFYNGAILTNSFSLSDQGYRLLIMAKAAQNITNCSIPAINQILLNLFPNRGNCYVADGQNMTMQFVFDFPLSPVENAIVLNSGVLPVPTGVASSIVINVPAI